MAKAPSVGSRLIRGAEIVCCSVGSGQCRKVDEVDWLSSGSGRLIVTGTRNRTCGNWVCRPGQPNTGRPVAGSVWHNDAHAYHHRGLWAVRSGGIWGWALTRFVPFELVDDILIVPAGGSGSVSCRCGWGCISFSRWRCSPSRPTGGCGTRWPERSADRSSGGGDDRVLSADLRERLGPEPLKEIFEVVAGPLGSPVGSGRPTGAWHGRV